MSKETAVDGFLTVGLPIIGCLFIIALIALCRRRYASHNHFVPLTPPDEISLDKPIKKYTYDQLAKATGEFSDRNLLGEGGFGKVYKGIFPDGTNVAIKQSKPGSKQGQREFRVEVEVISRIHHINLITLVGYCVSDLENMLVYEFVANQTLQHHLHGEDTPTLDWPKRMKIAIGIAKGLAYLHEGCHPPIIHRDIKAANILLDDNFEAKVADFGLAKSLSDSDSDAYTRVMGTRGYMDPEYIDSKIATKKADVYSFGVVLLELLTGRKPVFKTDESSSQDTTILLVHWACPLLDKALKNDNLNELVDPLLGTNYNRDQIMRMIACARSCFLTPAMLRPQMSQIDRALRENISLDDLNVGSTSEKYNSENLERARQEQEQDTSEYYTGSCSKHGLQASQDQDTSVYYSGPNTEHGQHSFASTSSE